MDPSRTKEALAEVWKVLTPQVSTILGSEVSVGELEISGSVAVPEHAYVARLESSVGDSFVAHVVLTRNAAIALGGTMMMMHGGTIEAKMASGTLEPDDLDAVADFVTQLAAAFGPPLARQVERSLDFEFREGRQDTADVAELADVIVACGSLELGAYADLGVLQLVFPRRLFGTSADATEIVRPAESEDNGGLSLTPEEMAAIRDATRTMAGSDRALVLVPNGRERASWEELLEQSGLEFELFEDVGAMRRAFGSGGCRAVIIDADLMPAGGLPALAALRSLELGRLPIMVVASSPTRTHLLRCVAAGAQAYLRKPLEAQAFVQAVQQLEPMASTEL